MSNQGLQYLSSLGEWDGKGGFSIEKISKVLDHLGNPHKNLRCIHVAGTNGKGSTSAMLAAMLGASGARVGLFTSPHLATQNERIIIDGFPVNDEVLDHAAQRVEQVSTNILISLSYFEVVTICAFLIFKENNLDWSVIEVGLGGRLDATNVIENPYATVIVTIGFDHQKILGSTLAQIATEKAGIAKRSSPMIIGALGDEARGAVERICNMVGAPLMEWGRDYFEVERTTKSITLRIPKLLSTDLTLSSSLLGDYQLHNTAVAAVTALTVGIKPDHIIRGAQRVFWPGRLERCDTAIGEVLFDAAHNPDGMKELAGFLQKEKKSALRLIFGVVGDKNWQEMISIIAPYVDEWHIVRPLSVRALDPQTVADFLSCAEIKKAISVKIYPQGIDSVISHLNRTTFSGTTVVAGSIYLLGAVREKLVTERRSLWTRAQ